MWSTAILWGTAIALRAAITRVPIALRASIVRASIVLRAPDATERFQ